LKSGRIEESDFQNPVTKHSLDSAVFFFLFYLVCSWTTYPFYGIIGDTTCQYNSSDFTLIVSHKKIIIKSNYLFQIGIAKTNRAGTNTLALFESCLLIVES
jgi:hypothetical protein